MASGTPRGSPVGLSCLLLPPLPHPGPSALPAAALPASPLQVPAPPTCPRDKGPITRSPLGGGGSHCPSLSSHRVLARGPRALPPRI